MISKIYSALPYGFTSKIIEVEGSLSKGLPAFNIVGMANRTVSEAKDRVRSAVKSSGFSFPSQKMTINLAPAELQKDGAYLDLAIALSALALSGQLVADDLKQRLFVGELSLSGEVRAVKGILGMVEEAIREGFREIFVPMGNLGQAALLTDSGLMSEVETGKGDKKATKQAQIYGVDSLKSLYLALKSQRKLPLATDLGRAAVQEKDGSEWPQRASSGKPKRRENKVLLDHIRGQELAKRAIQIAIAGHHNILISGPPGAGKTLLAKAAANLLPELTTREMIDLTKLYSLAGLMTDEVITERPFRSPHHTASATAVIGGGAMAKPGEISLSHKGILFLDEIPEFPRAVLEALRQPLEDRKIAIARTGFRATYPADFMLVATMNPCPCGYLGDPCHACVCTEAQIQNYRKRLSGPLFDRIDMHIAVEKVKNADLIKPTRNSTAEHTVVKNTITEAIERQRARYGQEGVFNSSLASFQVANLIQLEPAAKELMTEAAERLNLSARAYFKTIKVAQTIADLDKAGKVTAAHVTEALTFRER